MSFPERLLSGVRDRFNEARLQFHSQSQLLERNFLQLRELSTVIREEAAGRGQPKHESPPALSARLIQVVRLVSLGCNNNQIAAILELSESTIDNYRTRAMKLMDAHCSASLTRLALKYGFTSLNDDLTSKEQAAIVPTERHVGRNGRHKKEI